MRAPDLAYATVAELSALLRAKKVSPVELTRDCLKRAASLDPVSLSLAAHRRGVRNVYWPFARLRTEERFAPLDLAEPVEDPYLNPNLAPGAGTLA